MTAASPTPRFAGTRLRPFRDTRSPMRRPRLRTPANAAEDAARLRRHLQELLVRRPVRRQPRPQRELLVLWEARLEREVTLLGEVAEAADAAP